MAFHTFGFHLGSRIPLPRRILLAHAVARKYARLLTGCTASDGIPGRSSQKATGRDRGSNLGEPVVGDGRARETGKEVGWELVEEVEEEGDDTTKPRMREDKEDEGYIVIES